MNDGRGRGVGFGTTSVFDDFRGHAENEDGFELMVGDQRLQVFEEGGSAETLDA